MFHVRTVLSALVVVGSLWSATPALAQPLGTYRWQLLPYCNVVTLNVAQQGALYTLDGTDDRCAAAQTASARGMAFLNPNGTIGFGITMVQPGGVPVHLEATINLPTLNGTWRDSSGASGSFVLTPGAGIGGPPRLVAAGGVPPASITAIQLATGAVGASAIAPNSINSGHIANATVTGADVLDGSLTRADLADAPRLIANQVDASVPLPPGYKVVLEVPFAAPAAGRVLLSSSGAFIFGNAATTDTAVCSITTGAEVTDFPITAYAVESAPSSYLVNTVRRHAHRRCCGRDFHNVQVGVLRVGDKHADLFPCAHGPLRSGLVMQVANAGFMTIAHGRSVIVGSCTRLGWMRAALCTRRGGGTAQRRPLI